MGFVDSVLLGLVRSCVVRCSRTLGSDLSGSRVCLERVCEPKFWQASFVEFKPGVAYKPRSMTSATESYMPRHYRLHPESAGSQWGVSSMLSACGQPFCPKTKDAEARLQAAIQVHFARKLGLVGRPAKSP